MSLWDQLGIAPGSIVLDLGFGSAEELLQLANKVRGAGIVYGVEAKRSRVAEVSRLLCNFANVRVIRGTTYRVPLPNDSVNQVVFKGVLHEVENVSRTLIEARRVCKPKGIVTIVDFSQFPRGWMRLSNLKWRLHRPWRLLLPPLDRHAGFSKDKVRQHIKESSLHLEHFRDNVALGNFSGHKIPMFVATAKKDVPPRIN